MEQDSNYYRNSNVTPTKSQVTLGIGTTVSVIANTSGYWKCIDLINRKCYSNRNSECSPQGAQVTLTVNDPGIITWQPIDPGASQTWVNIDPY